MLETESSSYGSWRELLAEHGCELSPETWSAAVGTLGAVDPLALLEAHLGASVDRPALRARARARHAELLADERLRPGVEEVVDEARARGLHVAVVTSASEWWVRGHLRRLAVHDDLEHVVAADGDPTRAKPAPLLYLEAAALLGVEPAEAVAVEDSPNGVRAARARGRPGRRVPERDHGGDGPRRGGRRRARPRRARARRPARAAGPPARGGDAVGAGR